MGLTALLPTGLLPLEGPELSRPGLAARAGLRSLIGGAGL